MWCFHILFLQHTFYKSPERLQTVSRISHAVGGGDRAGKKKKSVVTNKQKNEILKNKLKESIVQQQPTNH